MYNAYKYISVVIKPTITMYDFDNKKNEEELLKTDMFKDTNIKEELLEDYKYDNIFKKKDTYIIYPKEKPSTKIIDYDYGRENLIRDKVRETLFNVVKETGVKEVTFYVPLYNETDLEYRYKYSNKKLKSIKYTDVFDSSFKKFLSDLPIVNNVTIIPKLDIPIKDFFKYLNEKTKNKETKLIQFYEYLFYFQRDKSIIKNIINRQLFDKFVILYKPEYLDKDFDVIHPAYYYELSDVKLNETYIGKSVSDDLGVDYINSNFKVDSYYRCIGKLKKIGGPKYWFYVRLKEVLNPNSTKYETLKFKCFVKKTFFGFTYKIINEDEDSGDSTVNKPIISNKDDPGTDFVVSIDSGKIKVFNDDNYNLLKYKNLDNNDTTKNYELFIPKKNTIDKTTFKKFLKKDKPTSVDVLNYLKNPTELKKYEDFLISQYEEYKQGILSGPYNASTYSDLDSYYDTLSETYKSYVIPRDKFKDVLEMLFEKNNSLHFKQRKNTKDTNSQYRMELNDYTRPIEKINRNRKNKYKKNIETILDISKPEYIIEVKLFLQTKEFTSSTSCKEIKYKINRLTSKLIGGKKINKTCNKKLNKKINRNTRKK